MQDGDLDSLAEKILKSKEQLNNLSNQEVHILDHLFHYNMYLNGRLNEVEIKQAEQRGFRNATWAMIKFTIIFWSCIFALFAVLVAFDSFGDIWDWFRGLF